MMRFWRIMQKLEELVELSQQVVLQHQEAHLQLIQELDDCDRRQREHMLIADHHNAMQSLHHHGAEHFGGSHGF